MRAGLCKRTKLFVVFIDLHVSYACLQINMITDTKIMLLYECYTLLYICYCCNYSLIQNGRINLLLLYVDDYHILNMNEWHEMS